MTKPHSYRIEILGMAAALLLPLGSVLGYSYIDLGLGLYHESNDRTTADPGPGGEDQMEVNADASTTIEASGPMDGDSDAGSIEVGEDRVEIAHEQPGRLLALFPVVFEVEARVYANGEVEVAYPWYAFLVDDNKEELEEKIRAAVAPILDSGVTAQGTFSPEAALQAAQAVEAVLSENLETDLEANLTQESGI